MWDANYHDYPKDQRVKQEKRLHRESGCEMQERFGWGLSHNQVKKTKSGLLRDIFSIFFGRDK